MCARRTRWLALFLLAAFGILPARGSALASSEEGAAAPASQSPWPFRTGRFEVGMQTGGGVALQHDPRSASVFALLPRLGYVFYEVERGLPGSVEVVAQPSYLTVFERGTAHVGGLAALLRYNFRTGTRFTPFAEAGAGASYASLRVPNHGSRFNFILETGVGLQYTISDRYALSFEWLYHHLSNADIYVSNPGLNTSLFLLGFSILY